MPYYEQKHLVKNAIQSIINQTFEDWELIIVNDGSDDFEITHIIHEFNDNRIRLYTVPHNGLVTARNFGNNMAKADIIVTQDSDDLSMPDRLEKIYNNIGDNDVLVHSLYINMWNPDRNCITRGYRKVDTVDKKRIKKEQYLPGVPAFKKELWKRLPFRYETEFCYDWMMWIDWIFSGAKIKVLDEGLYEYVRHIDSTSHKFEMDGRRQQSIDKIKEIINSTYINAC